MLVNKRSIVSAELIKQALTEKPGLPKQRPSACLAEDHRRVWWHLEIAVAFLKPVLLLAVYYRSKETQRCYGPKEPVRPSVNVFFDRTSGFTVINFSFFFFHWIDVCSRPELEQSLEQKSSQVHWAREKNKRKIKKEHIDINLNCQSCSYLNQQHQLRNWLFK